MSSLYELRSTPPLDDPVLVICLDGWIDAGAGAATAAAGLLASVDTEVVAEFDTDALLDHRARRPVVHIADGRHRGLTWPALQLRAGRAATGRDVLLLVGPEPDHVWRAFCRETTELVRALGVTLAVGLGAFPSPVPHTRPVRLVATASDEALAARVGFLPGSIDVPAGAQAALEHELAGAGIPAVGLWARVPHYVAGMAYPEASAALLEALADLAGLSFDTSELREAATETRARIDELIAANPEHQRLVATLEAQVDIEAGIDRVGGDLPSGDELAAELERFLRGEQPPG